MDLTQAGSRWSRGLGMRRLALFWPVGTVRAWIELREHRRQADHRLAHAGAALRPDLVWRARELTSPHERKLLARSVRSVIAEVSSNGLPGASPVYRPALRPYVSQFAGLADRLADLDRPVEPAGVLAVQALLTDPASVLYTRPDHDERPRDIGAELGAILDRLEVRH